ncbi:Zn-ribbon domain-containing OB-fold protein [Nocardia arizonensis]|uniref:Zn-ribbon domain-containing OB-fold protein n=1 Tax=Nocardia arizonensis TaxID=1141647 RepID=UPI001EF65BFC|nr:OB-fold domain-containing protein [Nocardia arizonensis]
MYPSAENCAVCGGRSERIEIPGTGTVFTFTVNHHPYRPEMPVPYVIALIELDEAPGLRVAANIVDCDPESVRIGMPVRARSGMPDGVGATTFVPRDADPA